MSVIIEILDIKFIILFVASDIILAFILFIFENRKTPYFEILIHTYNHLLNFDNIRINNYSTKLLDVFHYLFSYVFFIFFTALLVNQLSISSQKSITL